MPYFFVFCFCLDLPYDYDAMSDSAAVYATLSGVKLSLKASLARLPSYDSHESAQNGLDRPTTFV